MFARTANMITSLQNKYDIMFARIHGIQAHYDSCQAAKNSLLHHTMICCLPLQINNCSNLSDVETFIIIGCCGISFVSFLLLTSAVALGIYLYHRNNGFLEYIEIHILFLSSFLMAMSFVESFQWFAILARRNEEFNIGCIAVAFLRQYFSIALLVNMICIGIHLLLQICPPKCLQVIENEKRKKYKNIILMFLVLETMVPFLFTPWPFIHNSYGIDDTVCWISECNFQYRAATRVMKIVLLFMWPLLVTSLTLISLFATCIILRLRASVNFNANICSLLILVLVFFAVSLSMCIGYKFHSDVFVSQLFNDIPISMLWLTCGLVLIGRAIFRIVSKPSRRLQNYIQVYQDEKTPLVELTTSTWHENV